MRDTYQTVTDAIIRQLEAGVRPWAPRWEGGGVPPLPLRSNGEPYRGVNVLVLWGAAMDKGYTQRRWLTFNQARDLGAGVRKGEKASPVVYFNRITREQENPATGDLEERAIPFARLYSVFNVEQVDGLGPDWFETPRERSGGPEPIAAAEAFFDAVGAEVRHGGGRAFYAPGPDRIQLPVLADFSDAEAFYATRAHETVHWTGHESRNARTFGKRFGDNAYAVEELVAEVGAAFLCADLGLAAEPREDHASYLDNWLQVLKADKRAIFTAAGAAQAACDFINKAAARERPAIAA